MADIEYLKTLQAVRERSRLVLEAAKQGKTNNFTFHQDRMQDVTEFVASVIDRDFGPDKYSSIPPHGRWQHFDVGNVARVDELHNQWKNDGLNREEIVRRLIDLFFVSVLLDAGAGDVWTFKEPGSGAVFNRSEGIAVASLYMFKAGAFSSDPENNPARVDGKGLNALTVEAFEKYFQISPENPIIGVEARVNLLKNVGTSLLNNTDVFGQDGRPGQLVDNILGETQSSEPIDYHTLWDTLQKVLLPSWPKDRTRISGIPIGDAWPLKVLQDLAGPDAPETATIQPFHKLTQWLAYSLSVPFVRVLGRTWKNMDSGTGLPEYRNGGLFTDLGVLTLKDEVLQQGLQRSGHEKLPSFPASGDVIVEWRALTVALLDELHGLISKHYEPRGVQLTMAQMLEAGTWKGGRELAAKHRPETKSSPILIEGDGTLF
ncbi:uncharacterized protein B0I36DRAFT_430689 [Microdochium trichocladiopsis]|uniref:DUF1688-domain-containing protein n=1 Tax=Microdochium trichocladiopsis TaxID=1682393 RepID=A0A9P8Y7A0_9PEZI|nr:uncharacterized protein B0I36DRAFT_430689 [Microdochium trichocladiopsis]KAH7033480.1 hypothetical protein B0I36DRAFT_430689 [Microdochium trichocladiopsis]